MATNSWIFFFLIGFVSNHLNNTEKNSFIWHYLNELLDSENGTKNKKISMGADFWKEVWSLDGYILETVNS